MRLILPCVIMKMITPSVARNRGFILWLKFVGDKVETCSNDVMISLIALGFLPIVEDNVQLSSLAGS
jgi:hypothetical protein